jgi:hypothetical protein
MAMVLVIAGRANNAPSVSKDGRNAAVQYLYDAMQYDRVWHAGNGGSARRRHRLPKVNLGRETTTGDDAMAAMNWGETDVRAVPSRSVPRRSVARLIALRDVPPRRRINSYLVGLDDAGIATAGCDRRALAEACRGQLPL